MAWPINAEILQGIVKTSFYGALQTAEADLVYPKLCQTIAQEDLTVTYTSFGNVPEPRQMSGSVASSGTRQAKALKDYKLTGTVVEFETTASLPRSVVETNPSEIGRITEQMAQKCALFLDRRFIATALPASTAGYDGVSLYNDAHLESGTAQDNNRTAVAAGTVPTTTFPTAAELESALGVEIGALKGFTDDQGTPVNANISRYSIICPITYEYLYRTVLEPQKGQISGTDVSGGTGRFRGLFTVYASPFVATEDRHYLFGMRPGAFAVALLKNKDWEIKTNIGTDSDVWNMNQTALFMAYGRFEFYPWDWKTTLIEVWT